MNAQWCGFGENRGSIAAFLFVQNPDGSFTKLRKVGGAGMAQMDYPETAVSFGADSLIVPLNGDKRARSKLGSYYERFEDGTNTLFRDASSVQLKDLKVYHGVYEEGEFIPHTDVSASRAVIVCHGASLTITSFSHAGRTLCP